jgi:uncharacterized protein with HEPN domain
LLDEDRIRLRHMIDAAQAVLDFVAGRTRRDLADDRMLLFAILRAIEVIGEAAGKVTAGTRATAPRIPWQEIVEMRNHLIHGYFDINMDIVWNTATLEIPPLIADLRTVLEADDRS